MMLDLSHYDQWGRPGALRVDRFCRYLKPATVISHPGRFGSSAPQAHRKQPQQRGFRKAVAESGGSGARSRHLQGRFSNDGLEARWHRPFPGNEIDLLTRAIMEKSF
jgi:hypothetical protein